MAFVTTNTPAAATRTAGRFTLTDLAQRYAQWRLYRRTLSELQELSPRELADLGLSPSGVRAAAYASVYGA